MSPSRRSDQVRRRPRDRKQQIARVAAEEFGAKGYHAVSMESIAARVGISAAALYRHFPGKYDLLREAVIGHGVTLVARTAFADGFGEDTDPQWALEVLTDAFVDGAVTGRAVGSVYRWDCQYLNTADQVVLFEQLKAINRRVRWPLTRMRPDLQESTCWVLASAYLAVIASMVDHGAQLPDDELRVLFRALGLAVLRAELPPTLDLGTGEPPKPPHRPDADRYEVLLAESAYRFNLHGYRDTSIEEIARTVGMPASGVYRYFSGKSDILAAILRRSVDRASGEVDAARSAAEPAAALAALIDGYLTRTLEQPQLSYLYQCERSSLPEELRETLDRVQQSTVQTWVELLTTVRPELTATQARFRLHAALAVVVDVCRLAPRDRSPQLRAWLRHIMTVCLFDGS